MPLYYICTHTGFSGEGKPVQSIRRAKQFTSFEEADKFAKGVGLFMYAILQTCETTIYGVDILPSLKEGDSNTATRR